MTQDANALIAAIRSERWAILPEYMAAIEALAMRAYDAGALQDVAQDGHGERRAGFEAVTAMGDRLDGARMATVRDGAAIVPVLGPIFPRANLVNSSAGGTSLDGMMRDFRVAQASPEVERIVLLVDSPGGVVSGLSEAALAIRDSEKPVVAFVTGIAASAAYWLASQAGEIVMESAASVGSIGVVATISRQVETDMQGRRETEIVSSGAPYKRPDPETEDGRKALQDAVDAIEAVFVSDISQGRKLRASVVRQEFGRGAMVAAAQAVEAGMADRIGTLDSVLREGRRTGPTPTGRTRAFASAEVETRRRAARI